jgi:hypothetical protein
MPDTYEENLRASLAKLYHEMTDDELSAAVTNIIAYLDHVNEMYDELRADPERYARLQALTASCDGGTVEAGRVEPITQTNL